MKNETMQIGGLRFSGKYRFKRYRQGTSLTAGGVFTPGELLEVGEWHHNLVMSGTNTGTGLICQRLIGDETHDIIITSAEIGTGTAVPTATDVNLQTPTLTGIIKARQEADATSATIEFFISGSELANGTYNEFGIRCGANLFARSIISPAYTKATNEDTGVEYVITCSSV